MDLEYLLTGGLPILIGLVFVAAFTAVTLLLTAKSDELTVPPPRQLKRAPLGHGDGTDRAPPMTTVRPTPAGAPLQPAAPVDAEQTS